MGTAFTVADRALFGVAQPTVASTGVNPSGCLLATVTGPATSVSDGMTCDISDDLASKVFFATIAQASSGDTKYDARVKIPESNTSASLKILVYRHSTGELLSSATDLSGEKWYLQAWGY